jgi:alkyl sulfatase BDS1-like metallo-beta-lactamase superfamily hydrolase
VLVAVVRDGANTSVAPGRWPRFGQRTRTHGVHPEHRMRGIGGCGPISRARLPGPNRAAPQVRDHPRSTGTPVPENSRATEATRRAIEAAANLPFDDTQDFEDVRRGFVGRAPVRQITAADDSSRVVWDLDAYEFLEQPAPNTAHPSLWRQGQLLVEDGLFEVVPGIYQLRGFDLSVMSVIEGETGVIVIDPLTVRETAAAAFGLYCAHRGDRPVTAMIYTHSHLDHFGGVKGIITEDDVSSGRVPVIAPEGFMRHAVSENVFAGTAMGRRAAYMYGAALQRRCRLSRSRDAGMGIPAQLAAK